MNTTTTTRISKSGTVTWSPDDKRKVFTELKRLLGLESSHELTQVQLIEGAQSVLPKASRKPFINTSYIAALLSTASTVAIAKECGVTYSLAEWHLETSSAPPESKEPSHVPMESTPEVKTPKAFNKSVVNHGRIYLSDEDRLMVYMEVAKLLRKNPLVKGCRTLYNEAQTTALPKKFRKEVDGNKIVGILRTNISAALMQKAGIGTKGGEFFLLPKPKVPKVPKPPVYPEEAPSVPPALEKDLVIEQVPEEPVEVPPTDSIRTLLSETHGLLHSVEGVLMKVVDLVELLRLEVKANADSSRLQFAAADQRMLAMEQLIGVAPDGVNTGFPPLPTLFDNTPTTRKVKTLKPEVNGLFAHNHPPARNPNLEVLDKARELCDVPDVYVARRDVQVKMPTIIVQGVTSEQYQKLCEQFSEKAVLIKPSRGPEPYVGLSVFVLCPNLPQGAREFWKTRYYKKPGVHYEEITRGAVSSLATAIETYLK